MSVNDQSRKDPEIGQESMDLRKLYDDILPLGNVLITVTDKNLIDHHVIVPIPKSYEAAAAIAFDQLGEHIPTNGGSPLNNSYLTYGVKSATGEVVWAKLPPEFWKEVVKDGAQLKLSSKPAPLEPGSETRLAIFLRLSLDNSYIGEKSVTAPIPKTYEDAEHFVLSTLYKQEPGKGIHFYIKREGGSSWIPIPRDQWRHRISEVNGNVEIGIMYLWL